MTGHGQTLRRFYINFLLFYLCDQNWRGILIIFEPNYFGWQTFMADNVQILEKLSSHLFTLVVFKGLEAYCPDYAQTELRKE